MNPYIPRSKYWPAYTWKIQTSYSQNFSNEILNKLNIPRSDFEKMYFYIFDKVNASFYHLQCLKENQEIALQIGQELIKIKIPGTENLLGTAGVTYEPIGYEYEAFLITMKSALDLVAILMASIFNRQEDNINALVNNIKDLKHSDETMEGKIYKFLLGSQFSELFESFKNPSKEQKSKRNFAAHKGSLPTGTINIPINNPTAKTLLSKALNPNDSDPNSLFFEAADLIEYCEKQFYQSCDVVIGILSLFLEKQLAPGEKGSVYEQAVRKNQ